MPRTRERSEQMIKWKWDVSCMQAKCPTCGVWYDLTTTMPAEAAPCKACVLKLYFAMSGQPVAVLSSREQKKGV
jgi:hypothetical protein